MFGRKDGRAAAGLFKPPDKPLHAPDRRGKAPAPKGGRREGGEKEVCCQVKRKRLILSLFFFCGKVLRSGSGGCVARCEEMLVAARGRC